METESEITDAPDARELTDVKGHVSYEHVSFHYSDDNTPVLSDISIDIPAGKSVALVGPSGGGKTTICSLLPRFYDVTEGRITVDGKDIRSLTLKSLRNNIGTVQQDVYLFDGTIRVILHMENRELLMKRLLQLQSGQAFMILLWNFHSSMIPMSENAEQDFRAVRNRGFPLHVCSEESADPDP